MCNWSTDLVAYWERYFAWARLKGARKLRNAPRDSVRRVRNEETKRFEDTNRERANTVMTRSKATSDWKVANRREQDILLEHDWKEREGLETLASRREVKVCGWSLNRKSEKLDIKIEFMLEVNLEEGKRLTFKFAFLLIMFSWFNLFDNILVYF